MLCYATYALIDIVSLVTVKTHIKDHCFFMTGCSDLIIIYFCISLVQQKCFIYNNNLTTG